MLKGRSLRERQCLGGDEERMDRRYLCFRAMQQTMGEHANGTHGHCHQRCGDR